MNSAKSDMTIRDVRVTMLRMPWAQDPWLKGHAFGQTRDILICDVETAGGITGMGYLFLFRPGMKSIAACLDNRAVTLPSGLGFFGFSSMSSGHPFAAKLTTPYRCGSLT